MIGVLRLWMVSTAYGEYSASACLSSSDADCQSGKYGDGCFFCFRVVVGVGC